MTNSKLEGIILMEVNLVQTVVVVLILLFILTQCGRALWYVMWRPYAVARWFRQQGIQGPPYRLIVGSLPEIRRLLISGRANALDAGCHNYASLVQPFFQKWASEYGKTFLYWLGPIPAICSTDMELVKQVLGDRTYLFQKDYLNPKFEIILGKGLIFVNGDDWKRHRRVVHQAFNQDKLMSMSAMASESAQQMMERWFTKIENANDHQAETDLLCDFDELTLTVIARVLYGENFEEACKEIPQLLREVRDLTIASFLDPPIPLFRYFPTRRNRRSRQLDKLVTTKIMRLIHERLVKKEAGGGYGQDLLGLTVKAWSEAGTLSVEEIIGECKTFFAAGQDTTANLLTWAMFLLSSYPEWQEKVREEVLRECPDSSEVPIVDFLGKLKLLNMTLLETLRLYNPVPFLLRKTAKDTILANIQVPKGTTITIPISMLNRAKDVWGADANEFNPMRFENIALRAGNTLLSFSYGPRACIGQSFAMIEAQSVIVKILKKFSFSLSPNYIHKPTNNLTLAPRYGMPVILRTILDGRNDCI